MTSLFTKTSFKYVFVMLASFWSLQAFAKPIELKPSHSSISENLSAIVQPERSAESAQNLFLIQTPKQDVLMMAMNSVQQQIAKLSATANFRKLLSQSFPNAGNKTWSDRAEKLNDAIQSANYGVKLEVRSNEELDGALGAFAKSGVNQSPVIYINGDWLNTYADQSSVERVLAEELGHSFDYYLNGNTDTRGDEGELFVNNLLNNTITASVSQRIAQENDHNTILIDGNLVQVENAAVYFTKVFNATQTNKISTSTALPGITFKFTSPDPADIDFKPTVAGAIPGTLSYFTASGSFISLTGQITDRVGQGDAYYFVDTNTGNGYLIINPARNADFTENMSNLGYNSGNVDTQLTALFNAQKLQPIITVNSPSAVESAGYMEFTVGLAVAPNGPLTFTPTLSAGSATVSVDYTNSLEYQNSSNAWVSLPAGTSITMPVTQSTLKLRFPIIDDSALDGNKTVNLFTGTVTGATNLVNSGGDAGQSTIVDNDQAPTSLSYNTPNVFEKSVSVVSLSPTLGAGSGVVASYTVNPSLPTGLSINSTTGVISGTPTVVAPQATYRVTASNAGGSASFDVVISVNDQAPSALSYTSPNIFTKGVSVVNLTPSVSGGLVTTYTVSSLPAGLSINASTGVISGTPTAITAQATYTVTASNSGGSTTFGVVITVNDAAPRALSYTSPNTFTQGVSTVSLSPSVTGDVVTYTVSSLPAGLSINASTGIISGTPSAITPQATYTVTATNTGGSTTFGVVITVNDVAPNTLSYTSPNTFTKGVSTVNLSPSVAGGAVTNYSVSPSLPAGLSISASTGIISGTPSAITSQATYTVTASNTGGSTTFGVVITVNDVAPSALSYTTPNTFTKGVSVVSLSPTISGGPASYTVSPTLPAGLGINSTTGVISGTPTAITAQGTYTVTATNTGGSTTFDVVITVNDVAPSALSYTSPNTFTKGVSVVSLSPTISGGTATYTVSSLPAGLSINASTGVISGTPTAITAQATYTVTATNTGGSTTFGVVITVNDAAPRALSYTSPNTFTQGVSTVSLSPSVSGGDVVTYTVSSLPAGLSINASTGIISGTPCAITPQATYTVTATNTGGSTTFGVVITVNDVAPNTLSYTSPNTFTKGVSTVSLSPSVSGGAVTNYSVSPSLPAGLSISASTGIISGTPSAITSQGTYTVTASNTGGSTTFGVVITVNDKAPGNLSYNTPNTFYINEAITSLSPSLVAGGGAVVSYAISPNTLPTGLQFSTSTGVISGTPSVLTSNNTYTITATNTGGSKSADVDIRVIIRPPLNLTYTPPSASPQFGQTITPMIPSSTGGAVSSYSISPALPAGISLNPSTGAITGFLTAFLPNQQTYTVTATNSSGSTTAQITFFINAAPTKINLSKANIYEGNSVGDVIGTLSTVDPDLNDTHSYTLVSGVNNQDNLKFEIVGNQLKAKAVYNYDNQNVYLIRVRTTDLAGSSYESDIVITISRKPSITGTGYDVFSGATPATTTPSISKGFSSQTNISGANLTTYEWRVAGSSTVISNIANPVLTPSQTTTYEVTVTNSYGSTTKVNFTITVVNDYNINAYNLLTPNGDGFNDTFVIENLSSYPNAELTIFDNSGRVLYKTKNYQNNWDGTYNGNLLHEGTYYYIITFGVSDVSTKKGFITLIRQSN